jgi:hypothetical protein
MALAAGCTVVAKASELCPLTHHLLVSCFEEAGVPTGVLNIVQARREDAGPVVEALISHKAIRKVDFIGSAAVGSKIGQVCAKYLKPILMELGGKGPALVLEDADLEKAAGLCAMGGEYSIFSFRRLETNTHQQSSTMDNSASPPNVYLFTPPSTLLSSPSLSQRFPASHQPATPSPLHLQHTLTTCSSMPNPKAASSSSAGLSTYPLPA